MPNTERECSSCGRTFRGHEARCQRCRYTERECSSCGRTWRGIGTRCQRCQRAERECSSCGRTFRGTETRCLDCAGRNQPRECSSCGRTFTGAHAKCSACRAIGRECASCGRTFRGSRARCGFCQRTERECPSCGRAFRGNNTQCSACRRSAADPERLAAKARRENNSRRARRIGAQVTGPVSAADYAAVIASGPCVYCGAEATTADHIRPLRHGGREAADNLAPACRPCNSGKGAKLLTQWRPERVRRGVASSAAVAAEYERQVSQLEAAS